MNRPALVLLLVSAAAMTTTTATATADAAAAEPASVEAGRGVYLRNCAPCHARGGPGAVALARRLGEPLALLETRSDLSSPYVRIVVRRGLGSMPWLTPVELPEQALDSLVLYLTRSASAGRPAPPGTR